MSDPSHILYEEYSFLPTESLELHMLDWIYYVNLLCSLSVCKINKSELGVQIGLWALENWKNSLS